VKWWIVVLVLGVLLTASGTGIGRSDGSPGEITCGSEVMQPGDVCEETQRGVVTDTYTYEEKVRDEKESAAAFARSGRWVQLGLGAGLIVLALVGIVLTKRRRARKPPVQQWQQQPPQLQQQPHVPQHWQWQVPRAQPWQTPRVYHPPLEGGPQAGPAGHPPGQGQNPQNPQNTETPYMFRPGTTGWK
jgi:hypothetical protein